MANIALRFDRECRPWHYHEMGRLFCIVQLVQSYHESLKVETYPGWVRRQRGKNDKFVALTGLDHCWWIWRWKKGATSQRIQVESRSWDSCQLTASKQIGIFILKCKISNCAKIQMIKEMDSKPSTSRKKQGTAVTLILVPGVPCRLLACITVKW